jgi:hypothetical protein
VPAFSKPTSVTDILIDTSAAPTATGESTTTFPTDVTTTRPLALAASGFSTSFSMGSASGTGAPGGLQGSFTGASTSRRDIMAGTAMWIGLLTTLAAYLI